MREIKFRGRQIDNGEWVYGHLLGQKNYSAIFVWIEDFNEFDEVEIVPETVGQYTGLKDRDGKEIYEGDIVGFEDATETEGGSYEQNCIGVVEWGEETASFEVTNRLSAESWEVLCECAVIGNLIDSPELMEV